jgi:hypothetical protein
MRELKVSQMTPSSTVTIPTAQALLRLPVAVSKSIAVKFISLRLALFPPYYSPFLADTDGDGLSDWYEFNYASCPTGMVAHNILAGDDSNFNATPAIVGGQIILRSNRAVCRVAGGTMR